MLISDNKKFIFVHVYKNAGTSISAALLPHSTRGWRRLAWKAARKIGWNSFPLGPTRFQPHATAFDIASSMGVEQFGSYYSFAFVRNPWDWQVSLYTFMRKDERHFQHSLIAAMSGFDEYVEWRCASVSRFQVDFVDDPEGNQLIDYIGRFEQLEDSFEQVCRRIGVEAKLPRLNVSNPSGYRDFYSRYSRRLVESTFARDIERFKYSF